MKNKKGEALKEFVRVRPPISAEVSVPNAVLTSRDGVSVSSAKTNVQCSYDLVLGETSEQADVFNNVKPLLNDVLNGINGTVFAYGQTSAGKSHTMIGPNGGANVMRSDPEFWGLLPRSSEYLLNTLAEKERLGQISYKVTVSFMEIYNETLTDLLSNARYSNNGADDRWAGSNGGNGLKIREMARSEQQAPQSNRNEVTAPQEVFVAGLSEFRVHTAADVMKLVAIGTNNRSISSTEYNDSSSRSHAVLQLSFEIEQRGDSGEAVIFNSKLSLADLAGSEKIDTSSGQTAVGRRPREELMRNQRHIRELTSINNPSRARQYDLRPGLCHAHAHPLQGEQVDAPVAGLPRRKHPHHPDRLLCTDGDSRRGDDKHPPVRRQSQECDAQSEGKYGGGRQSGPSQGQGGDQTPPGSAREGAIEAGGWWRRGGFHRRAAQSARRRGLHAP